MNYLYISKKKGFVILLTTQIVSLSLCQFIQNIQMSNNFNNEEFSSLKL